MEQELTLILLYSSDEWLSRGSEANSIYLSVKQQQNRE